MTQPDTIIALVRHGETNWNREHRWQGRAGAPLNDLGRRQAAAAAGPLAEALPEGRAWSWMITSPQERAVQTGAEIADRLHELPISTDADLVERDYGVADGMLSAEAKKRWPDGKFPGMEHDHQLRRRGADAVARIADGRDGDGIVVAHGALIRALIGELCDIEAPRILNGAVNLIARDGDRWQLLADNVLGELPDDVLDPAGT